MRLRIAILFPLVVLLSSRPAQAQTWGPLVWADEFNGSTGSPIDPTKWTYDTGNLNVNNELEIYCAPSTATPPCDPANPNAFIDGSGHLVIQHRLVNGTTWTSARLKTQGVKTFQYGRIEASIQIPSHQGLWPAFWMLGDDITTVSWPACGEVDIMENWPGIGPTKNATTLHGPGYSGGSGLSSQFAFPNSERVDTAFHTYGIMWSQNMMQFYFDDPTNITFVRTADDIPASTTWPFNNPFFLIANMAVGGNLGGTPDATTASAGPMLIDYVRYYQPLGVLTPTITPGGAITVKAGASGSSTAVVTSPSGTGLAYLACTGAPAKATCTIDTGNPLNSHVVDFRSSNSAQATVRITTTANTASLVAPPFPAWAAILGIGAFALLPFAPQPTARRTRRLRLCAGVIGLVLVAAAFPSCGGGSTSGGGGGGTGGNNGTPAGQYTLTITAYPVSGGTSTASVPLTVQ
jgi:beta-glucanase (GH16 family)